MASSEARNGPVSVLGWSETADKEHMMKLDAAQQRKVQEQVSAAVVPEEHPAADDLKEAFGDHTFFLDSDGLNIVEPNPAHEGASGVLVKLASWANEEQTELLQHEPEVLQVTVEFESNGHDPAA